jgi:hypothetical protein
MLTLNNETEEGKKMTLTEFKALAAIKSVIHAFYTAQREGVSRTQAELWALQVSPKKLTLAQELRDTIKALTR